MKKILSLIVVMVVAAMAAISQAPNIFNYQGVARNSVGNVLVNKTITLRLTIRDVSAAGAVVYQESRTVTTNPFGLFNAQVGSAGATSVTGTIGGIPWGVGNKYMQVEIDPNGGTTFINIGTAQIASVPYSLFATASGDLVLPFTKSQANAGTLFSITNTGTGASGFFAVNNAASSATGLTGTTNGTGNGVLGQHTATTGTAAGVRGESNSTDANAMAVQGVITSTTPGGFSAGVRGTNNGTGGLGIGVYGSQGGSGWGVYGVTPTGIGVHGNSSDGFGMYGLSTNGIGVYGLSTNGTSARFENTNNTNASTTFQASTNGTGRVAFFDVTNPANATTGFEITSNGALASRAFKVTHTGFGGAVDIQVGNPANVNNALFVNHLGLGRGALIQSTNPLNNANIIDAFNAGPGWVLNLSSSNGTPRALRTQGALQFTGINEAANRILTSDASGNATWQDAAAAGVVTGSGTVNFVPKWTPIGTNLANSQLFDNGTNMGVNTIAPTHRFTVSHGGSTGISVSSTAGFSVVDINAQNGDAALRFGNNGTNQWNIRNRPADDYLEFFELGASSRMVIQDGTGNVGIGETTSPSYKLDVLHGGATGISSRSSASFSVVDIDGFTGDAALRFIANGVSQWNTRNRPADNYYEIFELGGGGSRVVIQDGTGNVGIGATVAPSYKLDVEHGGATGIRSLSTASFSVVDIDGFTGDAALRFIANGVSQWNTRNRPADNYYEIFELGGGGSRVVIQDGTGNVGIGATVSPSYKLDVEHGGATGIRSLSTASFSVVDIDGFTGDAALRFARNGINQWNTRNRPADDYYEIFELGGGGSRVVIQDGTGNVGIGETTSPSYRLDVLHGGATGIRSRSSASFSLMDIDAQNGDAALRFAKAGVNMWNTRNRPADDYYEIFELGGGGSRVVIQNGTGNLGVGETTSPSYKLDVLHGGASGIRSRSSATFSLVDIDGFNGDAALRFARNGVNQWNMRNDPANDNLQFFELGGGGERMRIDNTTGKVWVTGDFTALGVKLFTMDHPLDPTNKLLMHAASESNEVINFYSGNITTDASGKATVSLPDYFEAINKDFRYQLTVIGAFAQAIISKEVSNNKFEIATSVPNVKVSWEVKGVRNDAHMQKTPFIAVQEKSAAQKGTYIDPLAHNQPLSKGQGYDASLQSSLNYVVPVTNKVAPATTGGSLDQAAIVPPAIKTIDNSGSVADVQAAKTAPKVLLIDGSVAPQVTPEKKAEVKPVDVKGTSVEDVKKPVTPEKKASGTTGPESTKTD